MPTTESANLQADETQIQETLGQLFSPEFVNNPYPLLHKLRAIDPLFKSEGTDQWLSTSYRHTTEILRSKSFGHAYEVGMKSMHGPDVFLDNSAYNMLFNMMLLKDMPDHKRIRGLSVKAFGAARINEMQPEIQEIVDELIAKLKTKHEGDLLKEFAFQLPVIVICKMLGIPKSDWHKFLSNDNVGGRILDPTPLSEEELAEANASSTESNEYFADLCEQRRKQPEDDLITALVQAETEDGSLTRDELTSNIILLFGAGHETTVNLIGNGLVALFKHPDQLALLRANPDLMPNAVEELLRFDSSVQLTGRTALEDVVIDGREIKAGENVTTFLGASNRDPEQFERPDELNIQRERIKPVSFGGGIHTCLGAQLSRIEGAVALRSLLEELPNLQLSEIGSPEWKPTITLRGLMSLPATW